MPNFLNLVCRQCNADDKIEIASHLWLKVLPTSMEPDFKGAYGFYFHSPAICTGCGCVGSVRTFEQEEGKKPSGAAS